MRTTVEVFLAKRDLEYEVGTVFGAVDRSIIVVGKKKGQKGEVYAVAFSH